jgi:thiol-disulfide isomerase/thioredoxin
MRRRTMMSAAAAAPWLSFVRSPAQASGAGPVVEWPEIRLLDGSTLSPSSWRGQAAVLVFWATDCPFCQRHNAHVDKLHRAVQGQPLRVLGVALDNDATVVRRYMASHHYGFPVALDGGSLRQRLTPRRVIPMTCAIDRQGRLLQAIPGEMFEDDVLGLARVLQGPADRA